MSVRLMILGTAEESSYALRFPACHASSTAEASDQQHPSKGPIDLSAFVFCVTYLPGLSKQRYVDS